MRRELAILLGVLVPFAVLVAAGLFFTNREVPTPPPDEPRSAAPARPPSAPIEPRQLAQPALDASVPPTPPEAHVAWPRALEAPLSAVTPEVNRCFDDQRAHLRGVQALEVRFQPLPDGGFTGVHVRSANTPYLTACIEDVFDEVGFTPRGPETFEPASWTFAFDAGS